MQFNEIKNIVPQKMEKMKEHFYIAEKHEN